MPTRADLTLDKTRTIGTCDSRYSKDGSTFTTGTIEPDSKVVLADQ